jgi:hypothetical protein
MVYLLWYDNGMEWEDHRVYLEGIYSTEELAEEVKKKLLEKKPMVPNNEKGYCDNWSYSITTVVVDKLPIGLGG